MGYFLLMHFMLNLPFWQSEAQIIECGWDVSRAYWTKRSLQLHKATMALVCNHLEKGPLCWHSLNASSWSKMSPSFNDLHCYNEASLSCLSLPSQNLVYTSEHRNIIHLFVFISTTWTSPQHLSISGVNPGLRLQ